MASTSSPRKTRAAAAVPAAAPAARKRAPARPAASAPAELPPTAPELNAEHTASPEPAPAPAPARKRAPRKTPVRAAAVSVEAADTPSDTEAVTQVDAPTSSPAPAPARKTSRRPSTRRKASDTNTDTSVPAQAPAEEEVETPPAPEAAPAAAEPATTAEPAPEPVAAAEAAPTSEPEPVPEPAADPAALPAATEPVVAPPEASEPAADLRPPHSSVTLLPGVRHRLQWTAGRHCPAALDAAAQALDTPTDAAPLVDDLAVATLVRLAREHRHPLQVAPEVWDWLARARDLRARVEHLERQHPLGPLSPALAALVQAPLRPYQAEAALYAACAGRSLLADDAGLGKTVEAIAALRLIGQSFGAQRALVLCPPERMAHWQAQWSRWTGTATDGALSLVIADLASLGTALPQLQALEAEVVVVDEPLDAQASPWEQPQALAALQTLDSPWALVLARSPLEPRPQAWQAMLDWVDDGHFGAVAALQDGRRDALGPWMLRRTRTLVLRQLPETVEQTVQVPLADAQRAQHDALLDTVRRSVQRWERSQFLGSREQRALLHTLQALRQCGQDGKTAAALQAIDTALRPADARVVVFSQWPQSLDRLAAALQARGTDHRHLDPDLAGEARRALVSAFQQTPGPRVLLCLDDERGSQIGLRHAATAIVHLDRPWNPALLTQRLHRVHRTDRVRLVEVHHVVVADSHESRLVEAHQADAGRDLFVGLVDGPHAEVFLDGPRLARFLGALALLSAPAAQVLNPD